MAFPAEPHLLVAQYGELKRQIPLLYALLTVNACAVSYTHRDYAPAWLTIGVIGVLVVICIWRSARWLTAKRPDQVTPEQARHELVRTTLLAGLLSVAFISWSFMLDQYGGPIERGHVALYIAVTVIGCIFCLVHLPQAALLVTVAVTVPYLGYYLLKGHPVFTAMALNIVLVTAVMVRVLLNSFATFETLIRSQESLAAKQRETARLSAENERLAHTDALTGLPNRRYFFAEFERILGTAKESGHHVAVGVLDLDRFKPINDTHGHIFGDRLLVEVGKRLSEIADGQALIIARLGGDEFGVLLTSGAEHACAVGQRICELLSIPFAIEEHRISIGCSAGFAIFPDAGQTVHELFDRCDYALYHVKSARRGGCALFSLEHEVLIRSERAVEVALQQADLEAELHICFQPILCTQTGAVRAVEALGRWNSPIIGRIGPARFIVTAERLGIIHAITVNLFRKALRDFSALPATIALSFNLSAHDIASPDTVAVLLRMVREAAIDPKRIIFELTETALMRDFDAAVTGIQALRALGIRVALDDFGSGYSSLGYLHRLPLDLVKVDRSFIADMDEASGRDIIEAIRGLCETLHLGCIVEGVETEAQLQLLRSFGYRMAQGYLFAEPMEAASLLAWMDATGAAAPSETARRSAA